MLPEVETATRRVAAIRASLAGTLGDAVDGSEIEDALCTGCVVALTGDARAADLDASLELLLDAAAWDYGRLGALAQERRELRRGIVALRLELAALRLERPRVPARSV